MQETGHFCGERGRAMDVGLTVTLSAARGLRAHDAAAEAGGYYALGASVSCCAIRWLERAYLY